MIRIQRYFEVPFDDREISSEELRSFTEDHIGRAKAAGVFPEMVAATEALFVPFDAALAERAGEVGSLGGNTVTKDEVVELFRTRIRQRRGRVVDTFGEDSAEYREIFPQGLTYYTKATMETLSQRLDYAVEKFSKYQGQLGAELLAEFEAVRTQFGEARDEQVGDKASVSQARGTVRATRAALERQLTGNLLTLAMTYIGQPEKAAEFFDQSLIEDRTQSRDSADDDGGDNV